MALNKFMHPRNIYKTPPDFCKLAKDFKEFSEIANVDVTGKVSIDFKDANALRILTKCLLKSDFKLDVTIPNDRLVPTLPLRLNYILWIEDLLATINKKDVIWGLDIGTGASAVYPLLAAVKNKWHMVGTETDEGSLLIAQENVIKNNLQHLIELKRNTTSSVIEYLFMDDNAQHFDFCMCNPPFYTNIQELWESRSPARPAPKNGFTGSPHELITEGGELQFCRKMIQESKQYKDKILIFTSMVGHKYNLKELVIDLKAEGINHITTEFCQGRVTRWGLAWTYQDYDFSQLVSPKEKSKKKNTPIVFYLPNLPSHECEMNQCIEKLKSILQELKIVYRIITKRKNEFIMNVVAHSNTWSNQRRKRRLQKRLAEDKPKIPKLDLESNEIVERNSSHKFNAELHSDSPILSTVDDKNPVNIHKIEDMPLINTTQPATNETNILVQGIIKICWKDKEMIVEMEYLNGSAGKDGLHQIGQYIKNNWK